MALTILATYRLSSCVSLLLARGSVLDFVPSASTATTTTTTTTASSAIVNAANPPCLGGGGVDAAINAAGGPNLVADRQKLPLQAPGVRCPTGCAVRTGPNQYGTIPTPYVIHAVGPDYWEYEEDDEDDIELGHALLQSAYQQALDLAAEAGCVEVAFPLLSAGVYRGKLPLSVVLELAVGAIQEWARHFTTAAKSKHHTTSSNPTTTTRRKNKTTSMEITLCAYSPRECEALLDAGERVLGRSF